MIGAGVNDAANRSVGHSVGEAERVDAIMSHISGDDLVLRPTAFPRAGNIPESRAVCVGDTLADER